ncbi:MAG: CPBP family intramembrane glutamic endopeptidase, partial [Verrucomicrobiota bacterium]
LLLAHAEATEIMPEELARHPLMNLMAMVTVLLIVGRLYVSLRVLLQTNGRFPDWVREAPWILERPWDRDDALILLKYFLIPLLLLSLLLSSFVGSEEAKQENVKMGLIIISSLSIQILPLVCIVLMMKRKGLTLKTAFGIDRENVGGHARLAGVYYLAVLPFMLLSVTTYQAIMQRLGQEPQTQDVVELLAQTDSRFLLIYLMVFAVFVAPIVEELLFRGVVFPLLAKRIGVMPAIWMVSLLFGFVHQEIHTVIPLTLLSVAMCIAYIKTRSLLAPMLIHFISNGLTVCSLIFIKIVT